MGKRTGGFVIPFDERKSREYARIDDSTQFPKVGESYYRVTPNDCLGLSDPELFFKGGSPSWALIRDKVAPPRDQYWTLMEGLFADIFEPKSQVTVYLVRGHAATGKTTLIRSIAYDLARDFGATVLFHIPDAPLDVNTLGRLIDHDNPQRLVVVITHAADYIRDLERFVEHADRNEISLSLVLEERFKSMGLRRNGIR